MFNRYQSFEMNEMQRANNELKRVENSPLSDRQEGRKDYARHLKDHPDYIVREVDHILSGNYGQGYYLKIWQYLDNNPQMNHPSILGQWVANRCWGCPSNFARQAWSELTKPEQDLITQSILDVISDHKEERAGA